MQRTWMWENLQWVGDDNWIAKAIANESLIAVTDGSYMKDLYPNIHSAALVLECSKGWGRLWCSFLEVSQVACSYRGKLVGLMAINLIKLAINEINPNLVGLVHIFSDCLGALNKVKDLPPSRVPSNCVHLDVLKNILVNCSNLTFEWYYSHVLAHQDDRKEYKKLSQPSRLNCTMDFHAKKVLWEVQPINLPVQKAFPLEPICIFADSTKISPDMGDHVHYWAHCKLARERLHLLNIFNALVFDLVDWETVYQKLWDVPKMFQLWAFKQVMGIAGTMEWDKAIVRKCPSCMQE
jgi:hypothetical protein